MALSAPKNQSDQPLGVSRPQGTLLPMCFMWLLRDPRPGPQVPFMLRAMRRAQLGLRPHPNPHPAGFFPSHLLALFPHCPS